MNTTLFICSENFDIKVLLGEIPKHTRRFVIIASNCKSPVTSYENSVNTLGAQQPKQLNIPNQAITYGANKAHEILEDLHGKFEENRGNGICVIIIPESIPDPSFTPNSVFNSFKSKYSDLNVELKLKEQFQKEEA
jgi:hypothetical protein